MSSFLTRASKEEEISESSILEEQYEKMFPKIGRDFVYWEDFVRVIDELVRVIDPTGVYGVDVIVSNVEAKKKALEYKSILEAGRDGTKLYNDLINLDE